MIMNLAPWQGSALRSSLMRAASQLPYNTVALGQPGSGEPVRWLSAEQLARPAERESISARIATLKDATPVVARTYTFRYAIAGVMRLAGYLFAREARVLALQGNILVANRGLLTDLAVLSPRAIVLADDALADEPGITTVTDQHSLAGALFQEVEQFVEPLLAAPGPRRFVAQPNGWGAVLDFLANGFQLAGSDGLGQDAAWAAWEHAIAGRDFPTHRRPRRFQYCLDGQAGELLVRSGCCLYFTLPQARTGPSHYCRACFIENDARRLELLSADAEAARARSTP